MEYQFLHFLLRFYGHTQENRETMKHTHTHPPRNTRARARACVARAHYLFRANQ